MARAITLATGQWADLPLERLCGIVSEVGFDGLELGTCETMFDVEKAAVSTVYCEELHALMDKYNLKCFAVNAALAGQCVGDVWDSRLDNFAPGKYAGKPKEIHKWAVDYMMKVPEACQNFGVDIVCGFMGSPIWKFFYSFPQTSEEMVEEGFAHIAELWIPILNEFEKKNIRFAFEVHPTEIAFDYWSTKRLFEVLKDHPAFGLNFDPSHLLWQGVNPTVFLKDFVHKVFHVHLKDAAVVLDGRNGILGSHLPFGNTRRGWNFRSLGHGDVNFEEIIRVLNEEHYAGPLSVEWEDNGMERFYGLKEAFEFAKRLDFEASDIKFDDALKRD